jgi:branched-chain amino acid transport system ATP-binding protein
MLRLKSVTAGYDGTTVLRSVDFSVQASEVVALLGPNGAGKTTLLRTATGFVKPKSGQVELFGQDVTGQPAHTFVRRGICHVPEGRGVFPSLTVLDNLRILAGKRKIDETTARVTELFPPLGKRLRQVAGSLSGGEQQMLALSRAYVSNPKLVVVDEASLGLAPLVVEQIYDALSQLVRQGMALVLVEQYVEKALQLAERVYVLGKGEVIHVCAANETDADEIYRKYLGVAA